MSNDIDKTLILNRIKSHYKFKKNVDFAKFLGIAVTTLSSWYSRNSIDYELISAKCVDVDMNWLLTGEGEMIKNSNSVISEPGPIYNTCSLCNSKDQIIRIQEKLISRLEKQLDNLIKENDLK